MDDIKDLQLNFDQEAVGILPTAEEGVSHSSQFGNILGSLLSVVMVAALLLVLIYFIWGAYTWITAGGDSGKLEEARNKIFQAIIGIIVLSATTAIFMLVQYFLGINVITFN